MTIRFADVEPSPDVFAAVMATGILSIGARNHGYRLISDTMGVIATVGLLFLVALVVAKAAIPGQKLCWDLTDPDVTLRLITFVAACAVIDTRLSSNVWVARILGGVGLASWLILILFSARNMLAQRWTDLRDRAHGAWQLGSVGTSGLAIVIARAARHTGHHWWLAVAVTGWVAALGIYGLMTWLTMWRVVNERQDRDGFEPDTWILMGGMAIATLAGDNIDAVAPAWLAGPVRAVTIVTWVAATLWIPPLIYFALHRIRRYPNVLRFAGVWWAFVFPLGMYSAASFAMAREINQPSLFTVSLVFFWDGLAAWLTLVVAGLLLLSRRVLLTPADRDSGRP
ncbi:tellurite resistance/C4-dicarboxylate transporter family protein [Mycobacterium sp. E2479]|uniref:tellurite resistance/C4-dicarboxylate transporter family protein n=1 Tax=Mycobacterium sp. E2479 TaxID=1834134 RepID=UPI000801145E|nr:tellurite resistance/C4-dicarboxylate transporter family protein [Mycobacterium sp. E2479]OBH64232.1 C4-dicarboxylate ABC transporter [Mycobacterium sp. E2479]